MQSTYFILSSMKPEHVYFFKQLCHIGVNVCVLDVQNRSSKGYGSGSVKGFGVKSTFETEQVQMQLWKEDYCTNVQLAKLFMFYCLSIYEYLTWTKTVQMDTIVPYSKQAEYVSFEMKPIDIVA